MTDLYHRATTDEQMDADDLPSHIYAQVLKGLARVNVATLAARPTLGFLARAIHGRTRFRLLDVGFGDGDMLRKIAFWAQRRGLTCELVGIDLNPRSAQVANARQAEGTPITYRTGDYRDLSHEHWDIIVSSLVTHHMSDDQRQEFLLFMEEHAQIGWFVNDLHRHAFAYYGFPLLARLLGVHRIVREDGQLSIARSFRPSEWEKMLEQAHLAHVARVQRIFPFRLCVERAR